VITTGAHLPPLGLLYLSKILQNNGHEVEVIDSNVEQIDKNKLNGKIKSYDAVGLSTFTQRKERENSILIAKTIKEIDPSVPLLIGGPHCTILPELAIIEHQADICVTGYGEPIIQMIANALDGKKKLNTIPGIFYKKNKKIMHTKPPIGIKNLDDIPFPARELVDKYDYGYMSRVKIARGKLTSVMASRGCPFNCKFCNLHATVPKYQTRSLKNVIEEVNEIIDRGYKTIVFNDDNFLVNKKRIEKLMDFIISKNTDIKIWIYDARADSADRQLYKKMRDAGVELIFFGIENGNQDVLDYYNKKLTISDIKKAVNLSKEMGFFVIANFILGSPIETEQHIQNTIKFAKSLPIDLANFYVLGYLYGAKIREEAIEAGKIQPDELFTMASSERGLCNFTSDELIEYTISAQKQFYFNPLLWYRIFTKIVHNGNFKYIRLGLNYLF
jgi:anaerobic magnesium-protoporphyrin IX monomethyl ester cyclase